MIAELRPTLQVDLDIGIVLLQGRIHIMERGRNMHLLTLTTASIIHLTIHLEVLLEANRHEHEDLLLASVVTINPRLHLETTAIEMKDLDSTISEIHPSPPPPLLHFDSMTLLPVGIHSFFTPMRVASCE